MARHPSVTSALALFDFAPLPGEVQEQISNVRQSCKELAEFMADYLPNNPALTRGLIKLWEAKNELVATLVLDSLNE